MATEGYKRKISAILSADVVGYSRLMEDNESATVQTLEAYRETIIIAIKQHRGRTIDSPGDNILSEFASVVDAVQCAVEIQQVVKAKNADLPDNRKMEFRIGINLGDVIEEGDRIYGDGVNLAARIEGIADPGSIYISGSAYEQIKNKLALGYEDLGKRSVKNIAEPVHVYRIPMDSTKVGDVATISIPAKRKWPTSTAILSIIVALFLGLAALWYLRSYIPSAEVAAPGKKAKPSLTEKPSIAVLPFDNMSGDLEQEYFSDGISENILNGLAKNANLIVKARTSSFAFKGQNMDIREIGKRLNATHIVEGSVRKSGNRIRVTAQLIAAGKDAHIWSEQYDRELTDVFGIQDEITGHILNALRIHLPDIDRRQMQTASVEAYQAYLLGRHQINLELYDAAASTFKKAISLDSSYADAYAWLANANWQHAGWGFASLPKELPRILSDIERALILSPEQPEALRLRIMFDFILDHAYQDAIYKGNELLQRYPNSVDISMTYGYFLCAVGKFQMSLKVAERILDTDPLNPIAHRDLGGAFTLMGHLEEARQSFKTAANLGLNQAGFLAWVATLNGDTEALAAQLDLGESNWGITRKWFPIFEASAFHIKGEYVKVKETLSSLWTNTDYVPSHIKSWAAALEGDFELALDYYSKALLEGTESPTWQIQAPTHFRIYYPNYRSHPKYQKMLKDVGLDEESIAKLEIPPLPF